jgi:hypothetical protein
MTYLRYTFFLIVSSMVVKIPLMALFHFIYLGITGEAIFGSADKFIANLQFTEKALFLPLYLIYLPLFIFNIKTRRTNIRYLRMDMALIGTICSLLVFIGSYNHFGLLIGGIIAAFCIAYFSLTGEVHARLCLPDMLSPRNLDLTLPEHIELKTAWEEQQRALQDDLAAMAVQRKKDKQAEISAQKTQRKISAIFFLTAALATVMTVFIWFPFISYGTLFVICLEQAEMGCAYSDILSIYNVFFAYSSVANNIKLIVSLLIVIVGFSVLYTFICFPIYGPIIKNLWRERMRDYRHFFLAAIAVIFLMGLNVALFSHKNIASISMGFYLLSYIALTTSALHLRILKHYDVVYGIPDEPPIKESWIDRLLNRRPITSSAASPSSSVLPHRRGV